MPGVAGSAHLTLPSAARWAPPSPPIGRRGTFVVGSLDDACPAFAKTDRRETGRWQWARKITSSPSSRKVRVSPEASVVAASRRRSIPSGCHSPRAWARRSCRCRTDRRRADCSRRSYGAPRSAPPSSRGRSCCWPSSGAAAALWRAAPRSRARLRGRCRRRPRADRPRPRGEGSGPRIAAGRAGCATRNGASASGVTIHGETVVRNSCRGTVPKAAIPTAGCRAPTSR